MKTKKQLISFLFYLITILSFALTNKYPFIFMFISWQVGFWLGYNSDNKDNN